MIFFKNQQLLPLIWPVVALVPLFIGEWALKKRQKTLFSGPIRPGDPLGRDHLRRALCLTAAALFLLAALLRPSWNPTVRIVEKKGRDVVFLLDVSRSMTAADVAPSRLERAKLEIAETVQTIEGDRVALVVFAGSSVVKSPLTLDYGFFNFALKEVSVNSVSRGGTQLGDALRMVEDRVLDDQTREERDIILITDGEDQESFPVEAAKALGSRGVRLIVIGLGDDIQGARVKDGEGNFLTYQGREVWSRMDGDILRQMAAATPGGSYVPAGQSNFSLPRIYRSLITESSDQSTGKEETLVYEEKYQFFLALALLLLLGEAFRIIGPLDGKGFIKGKLSSPGILPLLALFLLILPSPGLFAEGRADLFQEGERAIAGADWDRFTEIYEELTNRGASEGKLAYNRGRAQYGEEDFAGAADSFGEAAARLEGKKASRALYNRGNALMKQSETDQSGGADYLGQAREAYEKALELDPDFRDAANNLELLLNRQEQQEQQQDSQSGRGNDSSDKSGESQADQGGSSSDQGSPDKSPSSPGTDDRNQNADQKAAPGQPSDGEQDSLAQDILNQEEDDREQRDSTYATGGGIYPVERDW